MEAKAEHPADDKSRYIARYVGTMGLMGSLHILVGCILWFRPDTPVVVGNFFPEQLGWGTAVSADLADWSPLVAALAFAKSVLCFLSAFFYRSWSYRGTLLGSHILLLGLAIWGWTLKQQFLFLACAILEGLLLFWVAAACTMLLYRRVFSTQRPPTAPPSLPPLTPSKAGT